jgi:spermidine synthase
MKKRLRTTVLALVVSAVGLGVVLLAGGVAAQSADGELVFQKNSLYHRIYVFRQGSLMHLRFGRRTGIYQTSVDTGNPRRHVHEYTELAMCGLLYNPNPDSILVLGLGGGVIPRTMRRHFPDARIDVAEIDPDIPPIAKRYFGFEEDEKLQVHVNDGRTYIKRLLRRETIPRYDYIVLDAFTSEYIPFHLMTREFLREVGGVLAADGVVVANVFYTNRLADAELATFLDVFDRCQVFIGARSGNAMLVSPSADIELLTSREAADRAAELRQKHDFTFDMQLVARRLRPRFTPARNAPVLTDDRAPVNLLRGQPPRDPWAEPDDAVELKDGTRHEGWILQMTEQQVVFQPRGEDDSNTRTWPLSQVRAVTIEGQRREVGGGR